MLLDADEQHTVLHWPSHRQILRSSSEAMNHHVTPAPVPVMQGFSSINNGYVVMRKYFLSLIAELES